MLISRTICEGLSDTEIIRMSLKDVDYFSCLYQRYEAPLLRYIRRISKVNQAEAEDILQDAFVKIWKHLNGFNTDLKLSSWLYRIVHNEVVSQWRKAKRNREQPLQNIKSEHHQYVTAGSELQLEEESEIELAIKHIPSKYREVLVLRYLEEMSYEDISDILKLPEGTVATRLNRAKKMLERSLSQKRIK